MFKQEVGFYLGREKADGFSGFVNENNLFLAIEIEAGISPDKGRELTAFIKEKISTFVIENLHQFDSFIANLIQEKNLPAGFSLSGGYLKGNIFYLKTIGQGQIYIRRKDKLTWLVKSGETVSGRIEENDIFIFTFDKFMGLLGGEAGLNKRFNHHPISEIIDEITPDLQTKDDQGTAALFLQLKKIEEEKPVADFFEQPEKKLSIVTLKDFYQRFGQQKTLTFIAVFILAVILFWSVGLGYVRRSRENNQKKINLTRDLITQKLDQAEQVAFLNMPSALSLIADSKVEVTKLKKEIGTKNSQIEDLEKLITDKENKILNKEEKKYNEVFDLTVDNKNAKGEKLYLNNDQLLILDKGNGVLFNLSLDKKSLGKDQFSAVKRSNLIALYEDKKYFFVSGEGIYQVIDEKAAKIIENDKDWGVIIDMAVFNGNIYLLDQGRDEIWKYLGAGDNEFGSKNSYFAAGQAIDLSAINSLAIDGSIYLSGDSVMVKYTSGLRDEFKVNLPNDNVNMTKIFTSQDLEKVYGWDKSNGTVYIMGKNGSYQEQVNSKILSQVSDLVVYKNSIYIIQGSKIYQIE